MSLTHPPIPVTFLRLFGPHAVASFPDEECARSGLFWVHANTPTAPLPPIAPPSPSGVPDPIVVETPSVLELPTIPPERRSAVPPRCWHGHVTRSFLCRREDSPNQGRQFYTCSWPEGRRCSFFRWQDENDQYSEITLSPPLTGAELLAATATVNPDLQTQAWDGVQQGSAEWHQLRNCRITASNFGSVHRHNTYCRPSDMLRQLLWPSQMDSCAMRYGSVNERQRRHWQGCGMGFVGGFFWITPLTMAPLHGKRALTRFHEFLARFSPHGDLTRA